MDRAHCPDTQYYKLKNIHKLIDCLHLFNFLEKKLEKKNDQI